MFYKVTLVRGSAFTVPTPGDLGEGYAMDGDLLEAIAQGQYVEEITEADLPAPLNNPTYPGLRLYRIDSQDGPDYVGMIER